VFIMGWDRAGFHLSGPALTWPTRTYSLDGPVCYHPFLMETRLGYGWGWDLSGDRAGNAKKDTPPQPVEQGKVGKMAGGSRFSGPCPPRNEL